MKKYFGCLKMRERAGSYYTIISVYMGDPHKIAAKTILVDSRKKQLSDAGAAFT